jgi:hypothetical protein
MSDENFYTQQVNAVFERIKARNLSANDIYISQQSQN